MCCRELMVRMKEMKGFRETGFSVRRHFGGDFDIGELVAVGRLRWRE